MNFESDLRVSVRVFCGFGSQRFTRLESAGLSLNAKLYTTIVDHPSSFHRDDPDLGGLVSNVNTTHLSLDENPYKQKSATSDVITTTTTSSGR